MAGLSQLPFRRLIPESQPNKYRIEIYRIAIAAGLVRQDQDQLLVQPERDRYLFARIAFQDFAYTVAARVQDK
jgi:hypothetical protein